MSRSFHFATLVCLAWWGPVFALVFTPVRQVSRCLRLHHLCAESDDGGAGPLTANDQARSSVRRSLGLVASVVGGLLLREPGRSFAKESRLDFDQKSVEVRGAPISTKPSHSARLNRLII